jgi:hypothetical protein
MSNGKTSYFGQNPILSTRLSTEERIGIIVSILAAGVLRLRLRQSSKLLGKTENSCVDFTANQSGGVSVVNTMENAQ